jgi:hypothetical protein
MQATQEYRMTGHPPPAGIRATTRPEEERYSDLLRHIASPSRIDPEALVESLREIERLHSTGHVTGGQLADARTAYAATIEREPAQGPPRSAEIPDDER